MEAHSQKKNFVQYQDLAKYHEKQKGKLSLHLKETTLTLNSKSVAPVKSWNEAWDVTQFCPLGQAKI